MRLLVGFWALLWLLSFAPGAAARGKLKWAHVYETSEPFHRAALWASDELEKRSNGKFEVFPASSLGKESDINQGLSLGTIEIITSGAAFAARRYPRLGTSYYPFLFRDADHLPAYAKSDVFHEIAQGFATIAYTYYGTRHVSSRRPFTDCSSMAGLKIRVPDVAVYSVTPRACGATPTPIAFAEVYLALQTHTVDARENPLTTMLAKKFFEVLALVGWLRGGLGHVNLLGSAVFAGMSGTALADAAGLGTIEIKAMRSTATRVCRGRHCRFGDARARHPPSLPFAVCRRSLLSLPGGAAPDDPRAVDRRHDVRHLHTDRGRRRRLRLGAHSGLRLV